KPDGALVSVTVYVPGHIPCTRTWPAAASSLSLHAALPIFGFVAVPVHANGPAVVPVILNDAPPSSVPSASLRFSHSSLYVVARLQKSDARSPSVAGALAGQSSAVPCVPIATSAFVMVTERV